MNNNRTPDFDAYFNDININTNTNTKYFIPRDHIGTPVQFRIVDFLAEPYRANYSPSGRMIPADNGKSFCVPLAVIANGLSLQWDITKSKLDAILVLCKSKGIHPRQTAFTLFITEGGGNNGYAYQAEPLATAMPPQTTPAPTIASKAPSQPLQPTPPTPTPVIRSTSSSKPEQIWARLTIKSIIPPHLVTPMQNKLIQIERFLIAQEIVNLDPSLDWQIKAIEANLKSRIDEETWGYDNDIKDLADAWDHFKPASVA